MSKVSSNSFLKGSGGGFGTSSVVVIDRSPLKAPQKVAFPRVNEGDANVPTKERSLGV